MRIDIITVLPQMFTGLVDSTNLKREQVKGLAEKVIHNLREYTTGKHRRVDEYLFGAEAGKVMQVEPIVSATAATQRQRAYDEVLDHLPEGEVVN